MGYLGWPYSCVLMVMFAIYQEHNKTANVSYLKPSTENLVDELTKWDAVNYILR
jgi:hypothetical protein